jgi:hypothetical protein
MHCILLAATMADKKEQQILGFIVSPETKS